MSPRLLRFGACLCMVLAGALPLSAGALQWDFDDTLDPTTEGTALVAEAAAPEVTPTVEFVTDTIDGEEAMVASFSRGTLFRMFHGFPVNGGGSFVNQYTLVMDVMFPDTLTSGWASLWQTSTTNANDGDWFLRSDGGVGISGNYGGAATDGTWHRLALVVNLATGTFTSYVDGVFAMENTGEALDGRWSLDPEALLFADESSENSAGFVNSVQFRDVALSAAEIEELGGPQAAGIPLPENPRDCSFRNFAVVYDAATNEARATWNLLPGDGGFRVFRGDTQVGGDLEATVAALADTTPQVNGQDVVYRLQGLVGGNVETECVASPVDTFACPTNLACTLNGAGTTAELSWSAGKNLDVGGYEVSKNGAVIATVSASASTYSDPTITEPGIYVYALNPVSLSIVPCSNLPLSCQVVRVSGDILFYEGFDEYATDEDMLAAGWEVEEVNVPVELASWTITDPGERGNPPTRDGRPSTGKFVISDSDFAGGGSDGQGSGRSHDLLSPSFGAVGKSKVWLHADVSAMLNNNGEVIFDVDVSTDGGTTWENIFRRVAPGRGVDPLPLADIPDGFEGGPQSANTDAVYGTLDVDLSAACAGEADVRLRFRQFEPSDDWWIALDSILVDTVPAEAGSQTVLALEGFDGGEIPDGWEIDSAGDGLAPWSAFDACQTSTFYFNGGLLPDGLEGRRLHYFGDAFALVALDDGCFAAPQDEWLRTPALDCTGLDAVYLQVDSSILVTTAVAEILLSVDGGANFDTARPIFTYNASNSNIVRDPGNAEVVTNRHFFTVPAAAGQAQVVFAFHYVNTVPDLAFWAIDNVRVSGKRNVELPIFHRGDPNDDGQINITDGIFVLNFLFLGGPTPSCLEAANPNDDDSVNITDGIYILNFLFLGGPGPKDPGPPSSACGPDPDVSPTDLGCASYTRC